MQSSPHHKLKDTSVDVKRVGNKRTLKEIVESENASSDISVCSDLSLLDGSSSVLSDVSFGWEEIAVIEKLNMDTPDENGSGSYSSEKRPDKVTLKWGANRFDEANEKSSEVRPTSNDHEISTGGIKQVVHVADENSSEGTTDDDDEISSGENKQIDRSICLQKMVRTDRPNSVAFGNLTKENHKNIGRSEVSRSESPEDVIKEKKLKHKVNELHTFHKPSEDSDESINDTTDGKKVMRIQKNNQSEPHDMSRTGSEDSDTDLEETKESNVKLQQNCRRISEPHNMSHSDDDSTYYSAEETRNKSVNKKLKQGCDSNNIDLCQIKLQSTGKMSALFNSEEYNPITPSTELELGQLTEDDEIWMIQCPITLDPQNLKNKDLVFRGSSDLTFQLKEHKQSYETTTFDTKKSVSCLLYSKKDHCPKAMVLHSVGLMIIKEIVDVPELETFSLPRQNNLQLPNDLKIRHPLFGIGYATELQLQNELSNHHSMAADNENRTQKDKRKSTDKYSHFNSMKEDTCDKKKKQDNVDKITQEYENNSTNCNLQQKNHHKTKNKEEEKWKDGKTVTPHQVKRKRKLYEPLSESVDNLFDVKRKKYSHEERPEGEGVDNEGKILNANKDFLGIEESIRNKKKELRVEAHTISNQFIAATKLVENPKEMGRTENSDTNGSEILNICVEKIKHKKKKKRMKAHVDLMKEVEEKSPFVKKHKKGHYDTSFSEETATSRDDLIVKENAKNKYNVSDNNVLISELDVSLDSDGNELKKKKKKYKRNTPENCIIEPKEDVVPENGYRLKKKKANYEKKLKKNKQNGFGDIPIVEDLTPDSNEYKLKQKEHVYGKCEETLKSDDDLVPESDENKLKKKRSKHSMSDDENLMKSEDDLETGRDTHKLKKNKHKRMSEGEKKHVDMSEGDLLASEEDIIQGNDKHKVKKKKYKHKKSKENVLESEVTENDGCKFKKKKYKHIMSEEGLPPENDDRNLKKSKHKYGISEDDLVTGDDEFTLQKKEHKISMSEDSILNCEDDVITRNEHELKKKIHPIISDEHKFKKKKRRHDLFENSLLKYENDKHIIKKKHKHIMCEGSVSENKESVIWNDECKVKKIKHKHSMSEDSLLKCGQDSVQENDEFKLKKKKKRKKHKHSMLNTIFKREDLIPESDSVSQISKKKRESVPSDILKFEDMLTETEHNSERKEKKSGDEILNCEVNVRQKYDKHKVKKKKKHKCDVSK